MGLVATPVVSGLLYQVSSKLYCPHAHIVVDLSHIQMVFQANIQQNPFHPSFELIDNVVLCQKLFRSHCRKQ